MMDVARDDEFSEWDVEEFHFSKATVYGSPVCGFV